MEGILTQGTKLYRGTGTGSPETFEAVGGILDFSGPTPSRSEIDTTDLDSAAKEYQLGLKDSGEMTFNLKYAPGNAVHQAILDDLDSTTAGNWRVVLSDTETTFDFAAFVSGAPISGGTDDIVKIALTLRITGDVTRTDPS